MLTKTDDTSPPIGAHIVRLWMEREGERERGREGERERGREGERERSVMNGEKPKHGGKR